MNVIWAKIWRDLLYNGARTLLGTLSIAVGVFALGLIFGLSDLMRVRITEDHQSRKPGHINFWTSPFDESVVEAVLRETGVADAEARTQVVFRWRLENETEWHNGNLAARADFKAQHTDIVDLLSGQWPAKRTLAVESQSSEYFNIPLGSVIFIEWGQRERRLPVTGIAHSPIGFFSPPKLGGDATFFATPETVTWLTGSEDFNQLNVRLEQFSEKSARELAERIQDCLERMGIYVSSYTITDPNVHWLQEQANTMFLILGVLGALALGLSAFLIINTTNAIITQQIWQIGVMKVLGATTARVAQVYLLSALAYGILALLLAVPLGIFAAHYMANWLLDMMGITAGTFQVVSNAVAAQVALGVSVPLLAALVPVLGGACITPHQAISSYGLGARFGRGAFDRLVGRIQRLPRILAMSLRNTFRRKARVALTMITLAVGGMMFIVVMSVSQSLNETLEAVLGDFGFDAMIRFDHPYRVGYLVGLTKHRPGISRVEVWEYRKAVLTLESDERREFPLWGLPPDSTMFNPQIVDGQKLAPADDYAVLLNNKIALDEGIQVGDKIKLTIGDAESAWRVVGLVFSVSNNQQASFVPFDTLARESGNINQGTIVAIATEQKNVQSQESIISDLRSVYSKRRMEVSFSRTADELREQNQTQFDVITYLMLSMAILAALVGSLGLMGAMSINVVERSREIGVMRAVGATSVAIAGIFISEGVLVGIWSWLLAAPISVPGARLFSQIVGSTLFQFPLDFHYSTRGAVLWLLIVIMLSALASLWPAITATRISVREALAYE